MPRLLSLSSLSESTPRAMLSPRVTAMLSSVELGLKRDKISLTNYESAVKEFSFLK